MNRIKITDFSAYHVPIFDEEMVVRVAYSCQIETVAGLWL